MFGSDEFLIYIPGDCIMFVQEGQSSLESNYDSYLDYYESSFNGYNFAESDGGQFMYNRADYPEVLDAIPDFLRFITDERGCPEAILMSTDDTQTYVLSKEKIQEIDQRNRERENEDELEM